MIKAALKNPYLVIVLGLGTIVLGLFSATKIPADLLPQFNTSAVQIVCFYPGMPPEVMEKDIVLMCNFLIGVAGPPDWAHR